MLPLPTPSRTETIADLLRALLAALKGGETITVGAMLHLFGVRGFAFFLFVLALLNVVIFMVPGLSLLFGLPMVILAVQMVLGFATPVFPHFIRHRRIQSAVLARGLEVGIRVMERVEHLIRPRLQLLAGPHLDRVHSVLALALAVMVALPVPLLNVPPSLAAIALALGMMQRDGAFIALAYILGVWSLWLYQSLGHAVRLL